MADEKLSDTDKSGIEQNREILERIVDNRIGEQVKRIDQKIDHNERINRIIDFFAIMAAAIVAFYTYRISVATDNMRDDSLQQVKNAGVNLGLTQRALGIADGSFSETKKFNVVTLENFHYQQRAYVVFDGWTPEKLNYIRIKIKNTGLTPATQLIHNRRIMVGNLDEILAIVKRSDRKDSDFKNDQTTSIGMGANTPDQNVSITDYSYRVLQENKDEIDSFNNGKKVAVMWGIVRYSDMFGQIHITRYCGFFQYGNTHEITYCPFHNEMD